MTHSGIEIIQYNEQWAETFKSIKQDISKSLDDLIIGIEHIGSTSIQGPGVKQILDIDIVIESYDVFPKVITGLEQIGYLHQEEWSFVSRKTFGRKDISTPWDGKGTQWMKHHLYVCKKIAKNLQSI